MRARPWLPVAPVTRRFRAIGSVVDVFKKGQVRTVNAFWVGVFWRWL